MAQQVENFLQSQHFEPVMASIPTGDLIAGGVVALAVAGAGFLIWKKNREIRRLRDMGYTGDDAAWMFWLRARSQRNQSQPLDPDAPTLGEFRQPRRPRRG